MARPLRLEYPGAIYHVVARVVGNWQDKNNLLFKDQRDYERFIGSLADRVDQFQIRLFLFCLMNNHFHLVLETPMANLQTFMQALLTSYSVYFNLRHDRHGHLFQGRYKSKLVQGDDYLFRLSRYVHLNPVRISTFDGKSIHDKVGYLNGYPWSSYQSYCLPEKRMEFIDHQPVLDMMTGKGDQNSLYRKFIESELVQKDEEFDEIYHASPRAIGSKVFLDKVDEQYEELALACERKEDVAFRQMLRPVEVSKVIDVVCKECGTDQEALRRRKRNSYDRGICSFFLSKYAGLTQREVADVLNIGQGSSVSQQIARIKRELHVNDRLKKTCDAIDKKMKLET